MEHMTSDLKPTRHVGCYHNVIRVKTSLFLFCVVVLFFFVFGGGWGGGLVILESLGMCNFSYINRYLF